MAKSQVNQSQVHSSVYSNIAPGEGMESLSDLVSDINALRSLHKDIAGGSNWYDATVQSQATVYAALHATGADAEMQGELTVLGISTFSDDVVVEGDELLLEAGAHLKITDLAHAGQLLFPSALGQIEQSSDLVFNGTTLAVGAMWTATNSDGSMSAANGAFTVAANGAVDIAAGNITMSAAGIVHVGSDFDVATDKFTVDATSGDALIAGVLTLGADEIRNADGAAVITFVTSPADSVQVENSLVVVGNLTVQGTTTYINSEQLIVQDAFIHIAVGSTGMGDSGIVLHTANTDDLVIGRNADDSEFIFSSQDVEASVDSTNAIEMAGANLVNTWMKGAKLANNQGSADTAAIAWHTPESGGEYLLVNSSADARLVVTDDLYFSTHGGSAFKFNSASSSQNLAAFEELFGVGTTLVGAIMAAGAAGANKATGVIEVSTALNAGGTLSYASVGALREDDYAVADSVMQVFMNGLRQSTVLDYSINADTGALSFAYDLVSGDVVIVTLDNAAL